jgi:hypothetical protein
LDCIGIFIGFSTLVRKAGRGSRRGPHRDVSYLLRHVARLTSF